MDSKSLTSLHCAPGMIAQQRPQFAICCTEAHITFMYENQEGGLAYTIRRRTFRSGKTVWRWEVRRVSGDEFVDCGISLRSHDAAETSALDAIFRWTHQHSLSEVHS